MESVTKKKLVQDSLMINLNCLSMKKMFWEDMKSLHNIYWQEAVINGHEEESLNKRRKFSATSQSFKQTASTGIKINFKYENKHSDVK